MQVYDYIDVYVPVLERMYQKRLRGYVELGYQAKSGTDDKRSGFVFDGSSYYGPFVQDIEQIGGEALIISPFLQNTSVKNFIKTLAAPLSRKATITVVLQRDKMNGCSVEMRPSG